MVSSRGYRVSTNTWPDNLDLKALLSHWSVTSISAILTISLWRHIKTIYCLNAKSYGSERVTKQQQHKWFHKSMYFTDHHLKVIKVTKHSKYCGKSVDAYNMWKLSQVEIKQTSAVFNYSVPLINKPWRHNVRRELSSILQISVHKINLNFTNFKAQNRL